MSFRSFLLILVLSLFTFTTNAQEIKKSKFILMNGDVVTGKLIEVKPGEFFKIEILGNNVITVPYLEVRIIYLDESEPVVSNARVVQESSVRKESNELSDFYFESNNELLLNIRVG